jgi:DNA polymerase-1
LKTSLILQIHDELLLEVPHNEMDEVNNLVVDKMGGVVKLDVPIVVDIGVGRNWLEAHQ